MMIRALGLATVFASAAAAECGDDVLSSAQAAVSIGSTVPEACAAPAAEVPVDGACATQTYVEPEAAVWTSDNTWTAPSVAAWTSDNTWTAPSVAAVWTSDNTWTAPSVAAVWTSDDNTWTAPSVAAVWTSANTWDGTANTCSDTTHTTEAECTAAGSCNDAGNISPADATACAQLFSDSGSCSDTTHTTEAECTAAGSCNDAGNTSPADATACAQLFATAASCSPPSCVLSEGTDCSTDDDGNDTGCIYTAPVPAEAVDAIEGSCSDGTYNAAQQSSCSDGSLTTEADCIAVGTCNDFGATGPADEATCIGLFADEANSIAAEWTTTNTWTAAVAESCTECTENDTEVEPEPRASGASTVAATGLALVAVVAQVL